MRLEELVQRLREIEPQADEVSLATLALMITKDHDTAVAVGDLAAACRTAKMRLQTLQDQRQAAQQEIDNLACEQACGYQPQQLFAVVRQVRTQGQLLELFCC